MPDTLAAVSAARRARDDAEAAFVAALRRARVDGATLQAIATVAGMTRQRVWQMTGDVRPKDR